MHNTCTDHGLDPNGIRSIWFDPFLNSTDLQPNSYKTKSGSRRWNPVFDSVMCLDLLVYLPCYFYRFLEILLEIKENNFEMALIRYFLLGEPVHELWIVCHEHEVLANT